MIKRAMLAALAIGTAASLVSGCTKPPDATANSVRNGQGQAVDPKTGTVLPGQGPSSGY
ncbi:MAG: hypothetical protein ACLQJR_01775 [Stellaceae bacterium]